MLKRSSAGIFTPLFLSMGYLKKVEKGGKISHLKEIRFSIGGDVKGYVCSVTCMKMV